MSDATSELAARLTERVISDVLGRASEVELAALRRYQAMDRTYELVNRLLRGEPRADALTDEQDTAVRVIVRRLNQMLNRWRTPEPIRAYRGLRSRVGFDVVADAPLVTRSFLSTTIVRDVAVSEFTLPPGPGGPALLGIDVPAGTPAVWVPPLGDPALAYQGELLLPRRLPLMVRASRDEAGILVVDCEVQP